MTDLTARVTRLLPVLYPGWDHMGTGWRHKARADTHALLARLDTAGELVPDNAGEIEVIDDHEGITVTCKECRLETLHLPPNHGTLTVSDLIEEAACHTCDDDRDDELERDGRRDDARP